MTTLRKRFAWYKEHVDENGYISYVDNGLGGQQRRTLDISRAKEEFGFAAKTGLHEGLKNTIRYYLDNKEELEG